MNFDEKLQIATFISILFGFALIIWEFQQSRAMTAAVLASDGAIHRAETDPSDKWVLSHWTQV